MRLIDADAMKELWQGCEIKGSISPLLDVRPTVDAVPMSVIEDIKAEIEQRCCITVGTENEPAMTIYDVFHIIDKHISGKESEE